MCIGEMAASKAGQTTAEVHFAQRLASNEKTIRDRALKKLRKWFEARSSAGEVFSESDFIKLWKGLHYCMWMQDKPLLQEELCDRVSQLVHLFRNTETAMLFVSVFFLTEAREWDVIDKWRVDKFMMLVRQVLRQTLVYLRNLNWRQEVMSSFQEILSTRVMNWTDESIPNGLRIHIADIYLDELEKVGAQQLSPEQVLTFLEPFLASLASAANQDVMKRVISAVFQKIVTQTLDDAFEWADRQTKKEDGADKGDNSEENEDPPARLQFDFGAIADRLFELGSDKACKGRNRGVIYSLVQKFRDLQKGVLKREKIVPPGVNKRKKLLKEKKQEQGEYTVIVLDSEKKKKKRQRKRKSSAEKEKLTSQPSEMDASPNKKGKLEVRNQEVNDNAKNDSLGQNLKKINVSKSVIKTRQRQNTNKSSDSFEEGELSAVTPSLETEDGVLSSKKTGSKNKKAQKRNSLNVSVSEVSSEKEAEVTDNKTETAEKENKSEKKKKRTSSSSISLGNTGIEGDKSESKNSLEEEVEIWIPNKKYKGKLKGVYEQKMKNIQAEEKPDKVNTDNESKVTPVPEFAHFEKLLKTPPAFVRKAVNKMKTPNTEKIHKKHVVEVTAPRTDPRKFKKRVSFDMNKNQAQDFKQSLTFSPNPFKPNLKPDQGILKSPAIKLTVKTKQVTSTPKLRGQKSTPKGATPSTKQQRGTPNTKQQRGTPSTKQQRGTSSTKQQKGTPKAQKQDSTPVTTPVTRRRASDFF